MPETQAPSVPSTPPTPPVEEQEVLKKVAIGASNKEITVAMKEVKLRGRGSDGRSVPVAIWKFATDKADDLKHLSEILGPTVLLSSIYREMIHPACLEASAKAREEEGKQFSWTAFAKEFLDWFQAPSRRQGGPRLKEINEKLAELAAEMAVFVTKDIKSLPVEEKLRLSNILTEVAKLNELREKKSRHPKTSGAAVPA